MSAAWDWPPKSATLALALIVVVSPGAAQAPEGFVIHDSPRPVPELTFEDGGGRAMTLGDFGGRVVLLNIWATWCGPCRREMPTLDRLQATLGGPAFEVAALSIDRDGLPVVEAFYQELGLEALAVYLDPSGRAPRRLRALGVPTTLLIDRRGQEVGRLLGPAEWDSPAMVAFLRAVVEGPAGGGSGTKGPTIDEAKVGSPLPAVDPGRANRSVVAEHR